MRSLPKREQLLDTLTLPLSNDTMRLETVIDISRTSSAFTVRSSAPSHSVSTFEEKRSILAR